MKNLLLSITIVLSTVSFSQIHYIETSGGVNISTIYNSSPFNNTSPIYRGSFSFGYTYKFSNKLTLGTNIAYAQSGFKDQIIFTDVLGNDLGVNDVFTLYLTEYISIPLKIGIETGSDKMTFSGSIGIVPAFNVGARIKYPYR
ncbi:MAG: hypothetical protein COA33_007885 [Fluviicola sp.]|nr:hypothetical protein [Fluviicola sp.]